MIEQQTLNPEFQEQLLNREIEDEDSWAVINSYFKQHGLVSQQISSFNRFLENSVQDVVKEHQTSRIKVEKQYRAGNTHQRTLFASLTNFLL